MGTDKQRIGHSDRKELRRAALRDDDEAEEMVVAKDGEACLRAAKRPDGVGGAEVALQELPSGRAWNHRLCFVTRNVGQRVGIARGQGGVDPIHEFIHPILFDDRVEEFAAARRGDDLIDVASAATDFVGRVAWRKEGDRNGTGRRRLDLTDRCGHGWRGIRSGPRRRRSSVRIQGGTRREESENQGKG